MAEKDTILFGKYQLVRILGQGRSGTVYLAFHKELEEYRAIKQVPKSAACYEQFRKEALLLKRLRHPGIPLVYDLEEDAQYSYLIEEFLEGDSVYGLVAKRGHLNQDEAVTYGIQICGLVHYLHSAEDIPILYLDLQPGNLLVCHGQVKLLDFDHSDTLTDANAASTRYGTPGFFAPEQASDGRLGVRTDVYQIGAVLFYLLTGRPQTRESADGIPGKIGTIIRRCLSPDPAMRYASAREVEEELEQLRSHTECAGQLQSPSLTIALVGARPGAGTTHIAIGLCAYLNRAGRPALYEERSHSNDVRNMAARLGIRADSYGIYTIFGLPMKPRYGEAVRLKAGSYPIVVRDYGAEWETFEADGGPERFTAVWRILGGKWWDRFPQGEKTAANEFFLYNHALPGALRQEQTPGIRARSYRTPEFADPFHPGSEGNSFYERITGEMGRQSGRKKGNGAWDIFRKRKSGPPGRRGSRE